MKYPARQQRPSSGKLDTIYVRSNGLRRNVHSRRRRDEVGSILTRDECIILPSSDLASAGLCRTFAVVLALARATKTDLAIPPPTNLYNLSCSLCRRQDGVSAVASTRTSKILAAHALVAAFAKCHSSEEASATSDVQVTARRSPITRCLRHWQPKGGISSEPSGSCQQKLECFSNEKHLEDHHQ